MIEGTVRIWHEQEGWGVIDSAETPGGCWAHHSDIDVAGYRGLRAGQLVELRWEAPGQDGYDFRATWVRPPGEPPDRPHPDSRTADGTGAYRSRLTITFDQLDQ
ncbi:MAG: cold shock domain-containing protein [Pseudonocardia sp.]|nr:cold shock domain-containing protein [Pseudonocardia sp.]